MTDADPANGGDRDDAAGLDPRTLVPAIAASHARLLNLISGLDDARAHGPSVLPGWSRGHVITHLARHADAVARLAQAAAEGRIAAQYPGGAEQRNGEIEAGASRSAGELRDDLARASAHLDEVLPTIPNEAWGRDVDLMRGRVPAVETLVSRWREVEVHAVDLDLGYGPHDWPNDFVTFFRAIEPAPQHPEPDDDDRTDLARRFGRAHDWNLPGAG